MNRLQLCQKLMVFAGISGTMVSTMNQVGEFGRVVAWIDDAWNDIQIRHPDWDWMRASKILGSGISFVTVANQASYPLGTGPGTVGVAVEDFAMWVNGTFRANTTLTGVGDEMRLKQIDFDAWRDSYMLGTPATIATRPTVIAIGPDESLCLGAPPTAAYTITGDYFLTPTPMEEDEDLPLGLETRYHMAIVWRALEAYGYFESATEAVQKGTKAYRKFMNMLGNSRRPNIGVGGALA